MVVKVPPVRHPTAKDFHARRCFLLGITDPEKVAALWAEECEARAKLKEASGPRKREARAAK